MFQLRIHGCIFLVLYCDLLLFAQAQITDPSEVDALLAVKRSLNDPFNYLKNWGKKDPCRSNWTGIVCYNSTGSNGYLHIGELRLLNMNLSGKLAPELGQLSQLRILDFMWNQLDGSIPGELGNISSMKLLLLNGNRLTGSLPEELGRLSNMTRFQVDENHLSGPIPESYANLRSVKHIHFNNNSLSGQIPSGFSKLSRLLHLLLDNNNLSGKLPPELSDLPDLRILQLDNNYFSMSEIPSTYGNISNLAKLSLRNCSLSGAIPDLGNISNLYYLDLSGNQLTGPVPSKLSLSMTTIKLSNNRLNGSVPGSFSNLPSLQKLSLENNSLTGSVPASLWPNMFGRSDGVTVDLRNNSLSNISGELNPPDNVTLRLGGNPICAKSNILNIGSFCGGQAEADRNTGSSKKLTNSCPIQSCPMDNFFEYVPNAPVWCFCASPLQIGYRLKSPSFSYFPPHTNETFEAYLARSLTLELYQIYVDSYQWEEGPRLRMYVKVFPRWSNDSKKNTFNDSEVQRIRDMFTTWTFPRTDFYGPYELLNFTLQGPYSHMGFGTHSTQISKGVWAAIILCGIAFTVTASVIVTFVIMRRHARYEASLSRKRLSTRISMKIDGVKFFTFKEMTMATDNFNSSMQVGRGGYGRVYRGISSDNTVVAVKRAEEGSLQGQKEFLTEIRLLSRLHHRNLVSLIGYCDEEGEQMLVYEFMSNGTLRDWLSGNDKEALNFSGRIKIALGSARGILYLHTEANPPVFHRDIKATNILLDSKLTAKVADFGLSRLAPVLDDEGNSPYPVSTVVKGTPGYLDPEYFLTHKLTDKSDVYSLGIVFLELLTGMQPIVHGKNLAREVSAAYQSGKMFSIIDSRMGAYSSECVEKFSALALRCCCDKPEDRPSMSEVVRELEILLKMMPSETDTSESTSPFSGSITSTQFGTSASSSFYTGHDQSSSLISGSDLHSGVVPTINPR